MDYTFSYSSDATRSNPDGYRYLLDNNDTTKVGLMLSRNMESIQLFKNSSRRMENTYFTKSNLLFLNSGLKVES